MKIEKELLKALKNNDALMIDRCFSSIFNSYYKLCVFVASNYIDDSGQVEDIVQDVFVSFYNSVISNKDLGINNIKQYLCSLSKNRAINIVKHNSLIKNVPFDESMIPNNDLPPQIISTNLIEVWSNLSKEEKKIIEDHLFFDKTFSEISKESGESVNTVKSRYRRIIAKMRKELI